MSCFCFYTTVWHSFCQIPSYTTRILMHGHHNSNFTLHGHGHIWMSFCTKCYKWANNTITKRSCLLLSICVVQTVCVCALWTTCLVQRGKSKINKKSRAQLHDFCMGSIAKNKNLEVCARGGHGYLKVCARGGHGYGVNFWQDSAFFRIWSHFWFSAVAGVCLIFKAIALSKNTFEI